MPGPSISHSLISTQWFILFSFIYLVTFIQITFFITCLSNFDYIHSFDRVYSLTHLIGIIPLPLHSHLFVFHLHIWSVPNQLLQQIFCILLYTLIWKYHSLYFSCGCSTIRTQHVRFKAQGWFTLWSHLILLLQELWSTCIEQHSIMIQ